MYKREFCSYHFNLRYVLMLGVVAVFTLSNASIGKYTLTIQEEEPSSGPVRTSVVIKDDIGENFFSASLGRYEKAVECRKGNMNIHFLIDSLGKLKITNLNQLYLDKLTIKFKKDVLLIGGITSKLVDADVGSILLVKSDADKKSNKRTKFYFGTFRTTETNLKFQGGGIRLSYNKGEWYKCGIWSDNAKLHCESKTGGSALELGKFCLKKGGSFDIPNKNKATVTQFINDLRELNKTWESKISVNGDEIQYGIFKNMEMSQSFKDNFDQAKVILDQQGENFPYRLYLTKAKEIQGKNFLYLIYFNEADEIRNKNLKEEDASYAAQQYAFDNIFDVVNKLVRSLNYDDGLEEFLEQMLLYYIDTIKPLEKKYGVNIDKTVFCESIKLIEKKRELKWMEKTLDHCNNKSLSKHDVVCKLINCLIYIKGVDRSDNPLSQNYVIILMVGMKLAIMQAVEIKDPTLRATELKNIRETIKKYRRNIEKTMKKEFNRIVLKTLEEVANRENNICNNIVRTLSKFPGKLTRRQKFTA
ncbi:MAG: hypothetical protein ABFQ95_07455 [Pseudomonadota bacterium]